MTREACDGILSTLTCCLCGFENWILTLRVGHRLKVFENRVLKKIFGLKGKK